MHSETAHLTSRYFKQGKLVRIEHSTADRRLICEQCFVFISDEPCKECGKRHEDSISCELNRQVDELPKTAKRGNIK